MLASRKGVPVLLVASLTWACQSPTSTTPTTDFIVATATPSPTTATGPTGRFYTFVSTNNQPSEQREYDWKTSFGIAVTLNSPDKNVSVTFPVKITSATIKVQQASGGIITPPTGSDTEHYEFEFTTSSNTFGAAAGTVNMNFNVWYDLPNLKREALVTVSLVFTDNVGATFSKLVQVSVAP
ncbi:MAG TPA: hypothetical protein VFT38_10855 [Vicinamibacteria bacterium]|nr:hypothetical protein [Vicinamibacteria bacterium]